MVGFLETTTKGGRASRARDDFRAEDEGRFIEKVVTVELGDGLFGEWAPLSKLSPLLVQEGHHV